MLARCIRSEHFERTIWWDARRRKDHLTSQGVQGCSKNPGELASGIPRWYHSLGRQAKLCPLYLGFCRFPLRPVGSTIADIRTRNALAKSLVASVGASVHASD